MPLSSSSSRPLKSLTSRQDCLMPSALPLAFQSIRSQYPLIFFILQKSTSKPREFTLENWLLSLSGRRDRHRRFSSLKELGQREDGLVIFLTYEVNTDCRLPYFRSPVLWSASRARIAQPKYSRFPHGKFRSFARARGNDRTTAGSPCRALPRCCWESCFCSSISQKSHGRVREFPWAYFRISSLPCEFASPSSSLHFDTTVGRSISFLDRWMLNSSDVGE